MVETIKDLVQKRKTNNKEKYMTILKNLRRRVFRVTFKIPTEN